MANAKVAGPALAVAPSSPDEGWASVADLRGTVVVAGYGQLRLAQRDDVIHPSDAVVVGPDSALELRLPDGGRLVLAGGTRLQLAESAEPRFVLTEGMLVVQPADRGDGSVLVQTPHTLLHIGAPVVASSSSADGDHIIRLAATERSHDDAGGHVFVETTGDNPVPVALSDPRDHLHVDVNGAIQTADHLGEDDPRLAAADQLALLHELDVRDPTNIPTDLDTSAGGDLSAVGPIVVTAPVAAFDLSPEPAPLAEAALGDVASQGASGVETRSHLADVLFSSSGEEDLSESGIVFLQLGSEQSTDHLLTAWDPGRTWKALGSAVEPLGNVELDWASFRQILSRDGPMAQLDAGNASVSEIEQLLGLSAGRLDNLSDTSVPVGGSAMRCLDTIHLEAGQSVWFDVFFDPPTDANAFGSQPINDFAVITVGTGGKTTAVEFADALSVGGAGASGWKSLCYTAGTAGDYVFGFAVLNDGYDGGPSRLYVDNVRSADSSGATLAYTGGDGRTRRIAADPGSGALGQSRRIQRLGRSAAGPGHSCQRCRP